MSKNKQPTKAFTRKPCVIATGFALSLMAAQSVYAQQAAAPADATQKAEKIEVTGTRIPPPNLEGASPVTVIDAASIKVDGVRSVENLLNNFRRWWPIRAVTSLTAQPARQPSICATSVRTARWCWSTVVACRQAARAHLRAT